MVHGREAYETAVEASKILFSNQASETLRKIDEDTLLAVMEGVERHEVSRDSIMSGEVKLVDLLTDMAPVFSSKGEMRKMTQQGALSVTKRRVRSLQGNRRKHSSERQIHSCSARQKELFASHCQINQQKKIQTIKSGTSGVKSDVPDLIV